MNLVEANLGQLFLILDLTCWTGFGLQK